MTNVNNERTNGITLLPCPFCGGEVELSKAVRTGWLVIHKNLQEATRVGCPVFGSMESSETGWTDKKWLVRVWNTRAERTCHMERSFTEPNTLDHMQEYMCSECGEYAYDQTWSNDVLPNYCPNCGAKVIGDE